MNLTAHTILDHTHHADDTITLDETARHRRRVRMVSDNDIEFLLDLPEARLLRHGEGIRLEDGRVIKVIAKPEPLYEIRAKDDRHLVQLAWQLGNRHLQTQILDNKLRIRQDHVIRDMLIGLCAEVTEITASFDPETGAYSGGHTHHHGHSHD